MDDEKRREERIRLEIPVMLANGTGLSRDISGSAIYFVTNQFMPPGSPINFFVRLNHEYLDRPLHLQCHGLVLRVEAAGDKFGIAASGIHLGGGFLLPAI